MRNRRDLVQMTEVLLASGEVDMAPGRERETMAISDDCYRTVPGIGEIEN